jgi:hypothetical protein
MAKARPFTNKTNTKSLVRKFAINKRPSLALRGRLRFKRRRLRLITRARLAAIRFITAPFSGKKKKKT